jgi:hypothetical protein
MKMKGFTRYTVIIIAVSSILACNLSSALTAPNPTDVPLPTANPPAAAETVPDLNLPTPTEEVLEADDGIGSTLDMCALITKADVEKFFTEPANEPRPANGSCTFTNAKDNLYAFSVGAGQDKESGSILQSQAMLLSMAGVEMDDAFLAKVKPYEESLDYRAYFTELVAASKSSDTVTAKLFAGGGNDLTYWAWISVPPRRSGAYTAVRGTTLLSMYLVVPESQAEKDMLTMANVLAGDIFAKLPKTFTNGTGTSEPSPQSSAAPEQATPTFVVGSSDQPSQPPAISSQPTATPVAQSSNIPVLLSPANGTEINVFPRTITLTWSPAAGASKYLVEIMACSSTNPENCFSHPMIEQTTRETADTTYTFNFVDKQPGKWRVYPMGADGKLGTPSGWWTFTCLQ